MKYYLDDKGGLWKKHGINDFYFSRKSLDWIKSKIVFIAGAFEYNNEITKEAAQTILEDYKKDGIFKDEVMPYRYFLSDSDTVFAENILGECFIVLKDKTLKHSDIPIDPLWGGIDESEIDFYL
nr:hypothetical protein [uncultured Treponema sp.]